MAKYKTEPENYEKGAGNRKKNKRMVHITQESNLDHAASDMFSSVFQDRRGVQYGRLRSNGSLRRLN